MGKQYLIPFLPETPTFSPRELLPELQRMCCSSARGRGPWTLSRTSIANLDIALVENAFVFVVVKIGWAYPP